MTIARRGCLWPQRYLCCLAFRRVQWPFLDSLRQLEVKAVGYLEELTICTRAFPIHPFHPLMGKTDKPKTVPFREPIPQEPITVSFRECRSAIPSQKKMFLLRVLMILAEKLVTRRRIAPMRLQNIKQCRHHPRMRDVLPGNNYRGLYHPRWLCLNLA